METRRWTNPHQPQTLQIAVILLYISAVFAVILPPSIYSYLGAGVNIAAAVAMAAGAFGIANEKRWGYQLAVGVTGLGLVILALITLDQGPGVILRPGFLLLGLFPVARFLLLVHPMSRQHQKIWFS
ncbi:MAG: hypothetical protein ACXIVQ_04655 [Acidimicrobiales bacterium]